MLSALRITLVLQCSVHMLYLCYNKSHVAVWYTLRGEGTRRHSRRHNDCHKPVVVDGAPQNLGPQITTECARSGQCVSRASSCVASFINDAETAALGNPTQAGRILTLYYISVHPKVSIIRRCSFQFSRRSCLNLKRSIALFAI